jgi:formylmethanofuran dehydrogenase subunit A
MADTIYESTTYKINGKVVSKEEYNELESKIVDKQFHQCKKKVGGGVSTHTARHNEDGKKFYIVRTIKKQERTCEIKAAQN